MYICVYICPQDWCIWHWMYTFYIYMHIDIWQCELYALHIWVYLCLYMHAGSVHLAMVNNLLRPLQDNNVNVVRFEVHFNVQGTGFDGTIKRGECVYVCIYIYIYI